MATLTAEEMHTLEMLVGIRPPGNTTAAILSSLQENGWTRVGVHGQYVPTDAGVRVTAPQHMKDVTP